jgi:hypothetical protein
VSHVKAIENVEYWHHKMSAFLFQRVGSAPAIVWLFLALFTLKALVLALWIVPLWDVPDEIGHFSYARDIGAGKGIVPLGQAMIEADIMSSVRGQPTGAVANWIVQHPPLYYAVAGAAWKVATLVTNDPNWLFKVPRIVSVLSGVLALLFIFRTVSLFRLDDRVSLAITIGFASIPMFSWLSAGTNHDTTVAFLGIASTYYFVRLIQDRTLVDAYLAVFFMSLTAFTKMTALVVLVPMLALIFFEMIGERKLFKRATLLAVTALAVPSIWFIRNLIVYGNAFADSTNTIVSFRFQDDPLKEPFTAFLQAEPVIEHFFINFFGLIGWIGKGAGEVAWFQIGAPYLTVYKAVVVSALFLSCVWFVKSIVRYSSDLTVSSRSPFTVIALHRNLPRKSLFALVAIPVISGMCASVLFLWSVNGPARSGSITFSVMLMVFLFIASTVIFTAPIPEKYRPIFYSVLLFGFFSCVLGWQIYKLYLLDGRMRATHGRYFYPLLGTIVISFVVPATLLLGRTAERLALPTALTLCFVEAAFFFNKVVPYAFASED